MNPGKETQLVKNLRAVRALICKGWAQRSLALDAAGVSVGDMSNRACRWCLIGAIGAVCYRSAQAEMEIPIREALRATLVRRRRRPLALSTFNDEFGRSKNEILELIDDTIDFELYAQAA